MLREEILKEISANTSSGYDLVVVGGGATGLGCALDASLRGYKTLLVEAYDFGKGASSKSTKLVHGGVRYLEQGNIKLVYEALRERGILLQNAPHIVEKLELIIPAYSIWKAPYFWTGLKLYDILSGKLSFGKSSIISKSEAIHKLGNLKEKNLVNGISYFDGQFDDARLLVCLLRTLIASGGLGINYMKCTGFVKTQSGKISGVNLTDQISGDSFSIPVKGVVNATGVQTEHLQLEDDQKIEMRISASRGSHIVVPKRFLPGNSGMLIPKTRDGRILFAIPWEDVVILGTTDVAVPKPKLEASPSSEEVDFILETAQGYLENPPTKKDVKSVFSGYRPLISIAKKNKKSKTKDISREHRISLSASGLVSISGGKWTTFRKMSEDTINFAAKTFGFEEKACSTEQTKLHGYSTTRTEEFPDHFKKYGSDIAGLKALCEKNPALKERIHVDLVYLKAEVVWACMKEMAITLEDILARRTRALFQDAKAAKESAVGVAKIMKGVLKETDNWEKEQLDRFNTIANKYII